MSFAIHRHWEKAFGAFCDWYRVSDHFDLINGYPFKSENFNADGIGRPLVRIRDLLSDDLPTFFDGDDGKDIVVNDGDIVIGMDGDFNSVTWTKGEALLNQRVCALRAKDHSGVDSRMLGYQIPISLKIINDLTPWSTVKHLSSLDVLSLRFPKFDLPTQRAIADFLDRETARIDLLIEKKQRLVALLGEKAKSVNELFFINADATGTQPLHRLYRVVTGKTPSRNEEDNFSDEEGLPWATPANLGFLAPVVTTKENLTEKGSAGQPVVDAGTVLLNGIGASVGKIGIAGTRLSFNQQIHALIPKKKVLADRFLFFQLLTLKEQLVLLANSTTLPILNAERLGRLELMIFNLEEQRRHCANMDTLLRHDEITAQRINTSIDRLKEYRSALITAAVTGQIDVSTYSKSGATDRRLDAIQEEMGA